MASPRPQLNRRAVVAGAAALVPGPALGRPATHPDAELLDAHKHDEPRKECSTRDPLP
jgi:hypothetical protein